MKEILNDLRVLWIDIWYYISSPFKRLIYGYDERSLWDVGYCIAKKSLPVLRAFRRQKQCGHPADFKSNKEWLKAIDEMIFGLEELLREDMRWNKGEYEKAQRGRELFGRYLSNLWD